MESTNDTRQTNVDTRVLEVLDAHYLEPLTVETIGQKAGLAFGDVEGSLSRLKARGRVRFGWSLANR